MKFKIFEPFEETLFCEISNRHGGVSKKPYDSLNLALHVGDLPKDVIQNRIIVSKKYDFLPENLIYMDQTHSDNIEIVEDTAYNKIKNCDALITDRTNIPLMVMVADCIAIMLYDPARRVIAAVHAGRAGTFKRIVQKCIEKMKNSFGTCENDILAAFSPSIRSCCYEVGSDLADITIKRFSDAYVQKRENRNFLDLQKMNLDQLREIGVKDENIEISDLCTFCEDDYFSYRQEGRTGRFAGFIKLKNG